MYRLAREDPFHYFCYYAIVETVVRGWLLSVVYVHMQIMFAHPYDCMYDCIYIHEYTALMNPNRAKQPNRMQSICSCLHFAIV